VNDQLLKIAITADPELPVPPRLYGGIERIIDLLACGLDQRGHDVTLFAHEKSESRVKVVPWTGKNSRSVFDVVSNARLLNRHIKEGSFDIVHSFSRLAILAPIMMTRIPKLMTYQRAISPASVRWGRRLSGGSLCFSAISRWMVQHVRQEAAWSIVPNGVALSAYDFVPHVGDDAPLVFLGRIEPIKGPHLAIEIARRANRKLVIAGNIPEEWQAWFDHVIRPLVDGEKIRYVGPVDDRQKNMLLGSAVALLMPILWDEPFGIVMAEAMACGTPVLGLKRGAVPEVVEDGVTGFVRDDAETLSDLVGKLGALNRFSCRDRVAELYSADAVVSGYLNAYRSTIRRQQEID